MELNSYYRGEVFHSFISMTVRKQVLRLACTWPAGRICGPDPIRQQWMLMPVASNLSTTRACIYQAEK